MGMNAYDAIVGLRAAGGSSEIQDESSEDRVLRYADEGSVASKGSSDGKGNRENDVTTPLTGGLIADESKLEFWASAVPRRDNLEYNAEKKDAENMVGVGRRPWAMARASDVIHLSKVRHGLLNLRSQAFVAFAAMVIHIYILVSSRADVRREYPCVTSKKIASHCLFSEMRETLSGETPGEKSRS